jgi:hypothetical protein
MPVNRQKNDLFLTHMSKLLGIEHGTLPDITNQLLETAREKVLKDQDEIQKIKDCFIKDFEEVKSLYQK